MIKYYKGILKFLFAIMLLHTSSLLFAQGYYNTTNWKFSNPKQFGFTVLDVDYFDNNNVIAVGSDGGIAKSVDGGSNWTYGPFTFVTAAGTLTKPTFNDVHFINSNIVTITQITVSCLILNI